MIISRNLLAEFYPGIRNLTFGEITEVFFKIGIEVEEFERIVSPEGLYYGIIEDFSKVEGSDKLNLCSVFIPWKNETFSIVCGAGNVRKGMGVVVALPGAKLGNGNVKITERKFESWGATSYGMLCSYLELYSNSLLRDISGFEKGKIIELGERWDLNREFRCEDLWLDDWVFDLFIPANRGDLHSAWGISREMAKILNEPVSNLSHGSIYFQDQDPWMLKRVLLTNNQKNVDSSSFEENLDKYLYLSFNESNRKEGVLVRPKSSYFKRLRDGIVGGKPLEEFSMRRMEMDGERVLSLLGLPFDWGWRGDLFVFESGYAEVPEWREDVVSYRDIADEVVGILGWKEIKSEPIPINSSRENDNSLILSIEKMREFFRNFGLYECTTFNLHPRNENEVTLKNPLSKDHVSLREHALNELVEVLMTNQQSKRDLFPVFEIFESQTPNPQWTLNIVIPEIQNHFPLGKTQLSLDLYDLQALLRKCFRYLNLRPKFNCEIKNKKLLNKLPLIGEKSRLEIVDQNSRSIGFMGYIKHSSKLWGCHCVLSHYHSDIHTATSPSKYPPVYKDISISIDRSKGTTLEAIASSLKGKYFVSWSLVEKYEKENSLNYLLRVKLQSSTGTLTGQEIRDEMEMLNSRLSALEGVEIR